MTDIVLVLLFAIIILIGYLVMARVDWLLKKMGVYKIGEGENRGSCKVRPNRRILTSTFLSVCRHPHQMQKSSMLLRR